MKKVILLGLMALFISNCGGGGTNNPDKTNNAINNSSVKDIVLNNKNWYLLKDDNLNNDQNKSKIFTFQENILEVKVFNDNNFSDLNKTYTFNISSFQDNEFKINSSNTEYDCSIDNFAYDEKSCLEIQCIDLNGSSNSDNLNYNIFNSKENAIKHNGNYYN